MRAKDIAITWPLRGPESVVEFVLKGAVRSRMVYERQTPEIQQRIREALATATNAYLQRGSSGIPNAALLVTAPQVMKIQGACHCGDISYEAIIDPARVSICHCTDCQALTGSAYRVTVPTLIKDFELRTGIAEDLYQDGR